MPFKKGENKSKIFKLSKEEFLIEYEKVDFQITKLKTVLKISYTMIRNFMELHKIHVEKKRPQAYTNKKYGRLTVLEHYYKPPLRCLFIKCKCDCGKEIIARKATVFKGKFDGTRSCGCLKKDCVKERTSRLPFEKVAKKALFRKYNTSSERRIPNKQHIQFELNQEQFEDLISQNCFYCNCAPNNTQKVGAGKKEKVFLYSGLDRIDSDLNYTKDNCVPCCIDCNNGKKTYNLKDFLDHILLLNNKINSFQYINYSNLPLLSPLTFNQGFRSALNGYKSRSKKYNREWKLTDIDFANITQQNCAYCHTPPSNIATVKLAHSEIIYKYNGIDRIDSSKGYLPDNTIPCCHRCNFMKWDSPQEYFFDWIKRTAIHIQNNLTHFL